jgi:two-component system, OmpR family, phosphate regulon sensor histidine kinase PhoR
MASFQIRSSAIRFGIFISTLVIATILIFQLAWLNKVYHFEQKEFDRSVVKAIRGLYEDLDMTAYNSSHLNELVERPGKHLYIARINWPVNTDSLSGYLQYELEDFDIFTKCQLEVYSAAKKAYVYSDVLVPAGAKELAGKRPQLLQRDFDYMALYFPNREQYIISQMNFWIITSALLLVVLILFGGSLYYFYKQKFLNETQQDFIHSFTHEFKTPVSVLNLAADVLKDENIASKPGRLATYAGIVEYQSNYLHSQINKLLQFAYAESGKLHLKKEPVDIHELIHEAVNNLAPLISEKKARLDYKFEAAKHVLQADRDYILIVITNLVDNALKYSGNPEIIISTQSDNEWVTIAVKDNGIGIAEGEMKKLFRKFYRVRMGDVYATKGFGLGLAFIRRILRAHKGKILVESKEGTGSIFTIKLPIR